MYFNTAIPYLALGLLGAAAVAATPQSVSSPSTITPSPTVPASCTSTVSGLQQGPSCYTYTHATHPIACPKEQCIKPTDQVCPQYFKITTLVVPCSTDCCPTTATTYTTTPCAGCPTTCVIPTSTETITTGCSTFSEDFSEPTGY